MARVKKGDERMTKLIRVYEDSAEFIDELVKRRSPKTTFADVVEDALRKAYPELYDGVLQAKAQAKALIDKAGNISDD